MIFCGLSPVNIKRYDPVPGGKVTDPAGEENSRTAGFFPVIQKNSGFSWNVLESKENKQVLLGDKVHFFKKL